MHFITPSVSTIVYSHFNTAFSVDVKKLLYNLCTLFQNGRHLSSLLFPCKLAPLASLSNVKFKRIFNHFKRTPVYFNWNFLIYWSAITNFKILRELGRGENDVKDSLV